MHRRHIILGIGLLTLLALAVLQYERPLRSTSTDSARSAEKKPLLADHQRASEKAPASFGKLPLYFERNDGQVDSKVKFLSRSTAHSVFLTANEAVMVLLHDGTPGSAEEHSVGLSEDPLGSLPEDRKAISRSVLRLQFVGANPDPRVRGAEMFSGKVNYFIGNDPSKWQAGVPTYARVNYEDVYDGIDLVYYGNAGQLEYDFVVRPGTSPSDIRLAFKGANQMAVDGEGNLLLETPAGRVIQHAPVVFQEVNGAKNPVTGRYVIHDKNEVTFEIGDYDRSLSLVIDPTIVFLTYHGGTGSFAGTAGLSLDSSGNLTVTGSTNSLDFPTVSPLALPVHDGAT